MNGRTPAPRPHTQRAPDVTLMATVYEYHVGVQQKWWLYTTERTAKKIMIKKQKKNMINKKRCMTVSTAKKICDGGPLLASESPLGPGGEPQSDPQDALGKRAPEGALPQSAGRQERRLVEGKVGALGCGGGGAMERVMFCGGIVTPNSNLRISNRFVYVFVPPFIHCNNKYDFNLKQKKTTPGLQRFVA